MGLPRKNIRGHFSLIQNPVLLCLLLSTRYWMTKKKKKKSCKMNAHLCKFILNNVGTTSLKCLKDALVLSFHLILMPSLKTFSFSSISYWLVFDKQIIDHSLRFVPDSSLHLMQHSNTCLETFISMVQRCTVILSVMLRISLCMLQLELPSHQISQPF